MTENEDKLNREISYIYQIMIENISLLTEKDRALHSINS